MKKKLILALIVFVAGIIVGLTVDIDKSETSEKSTPKETTTQVTTQKKDGNKQATQSKQSVTKQEPVEKKQMLETTSVKQEQPQETEPEVTNRQNVSQTSPEATLNILTDFLKEYGANLTLKGAEDSKRNEVQTVINRTNKLKGTDYYQKALDEIKKYCPQYAEEYEKNGKYFESESDFYEAYITDNYSKILRKNKKSKK